MPIPKGPEKRSVSSMPPAQGSQNGDASPPAARTQMESFQEGMRLFHVRRLAEAREMFVAAAKGADLAVAHRAGLHARMCEQRLEQSAGISLETPEDRYNYAITLINSRDLQAALPHLLAALEANPAADHVLYALAACHSLAGDTHSACENLKRAIELQPRNRAAARQDPDFAGIAADPRMAQLLFPERK